MKITPPDQNPDELIVCSYMQDYSPAGEYGQGVMVLTTADIIAALSDMADVDAATVNRVLVQLGFVPGRNNSGAFGWLVTVPRT